MTGLPAEKYFLNEVFQATPVNFFEVLQTKRGSFLHTITVSFAVYNFMAGNRFISSTDQNSRCVEKPRSEFHHLTNFTRFTSNWLVAGITSHTGTNW